MCGVCVFVWECVDPLAHMAGMREALSGAVSVEDADLDSGIAHAQWKSTTDADAIEQTPAVSRGYVSLSIYLSFYVCVYMSV